MRNLFVSMNLKNSLCAALISLATCMSFTSCGDSGDAEVTTDKPTFAKTNSKTEGIKEAGDGKELSEKEKRQKAMEERGKQWFEDKDLDGDGCLTQEEMGNVYWAFFHQADEDGDGKVTGDDIKSAFEQGRMKRPEPSKVMEIVDTDADGFIGSSELPTEMQVGIGMFDMDGDSKISILEIEAFNAKQDADRERNRLDREGAKSGGGENPDGGNSDSGL